MKRSVWIPLAAAGVALAGVAAGVMRALKKQKKAAEAAEEPVVEVEGEDVVEVEVTEECCGCCEAEAPAETPAENTEPAADGETPAEE